MCRNGGPGGARPAAGGTSSRRSEPELARHALGLIKGLFKIVSVGRIFVCTEPQDMRRGFDRLAQVVQQVMGGDPRSGDLFRLHQSGVRSAEDAVVGPQRLRGPVQAASWCDDAGAEDRGPLAAGDRTRPASIPRRGRARRRRVLRRGGPGDTHVMRGAGGPWTKRSGWREKARPARR